MPKKINEFRYPPKATDLNKIKDPDSFWGWSIQSAAKSAGLNDFPNNMKSMADIILWLNYAAQAWNNIQREGVVGESKMIKSVKPMKYWDKEKLFDVLPWDKNEELSIAVGIEDGNEILTELNLSLTIHILPNAVSMFAPINVSGGNYDLDEALIDYANSYAEELWGIREVEWRIESIEKMPNGNGFKAYMLVMEFSPYNSLDIDNFRHYKLGKELSKKGEPKVNIREAIRKMVRSQLITELKKYKAEKVEFKKTGKETPSIKVDRKLTKEDEHEFNTLADKQDSEMKKNKHTGVPTDAEWKRLRNAEEVEASATHEEIVETWNKLTEKISKELEEMHELANKIGDKTLNDCLCELDKTHFSNMNENRTRYKFIRLQYAVRPAAARLKSIKDNSDESKHADIDKLYKLLEKYLRVEVKRKHTTETEREEEHEKDFEKLVK